MVLLLLPGKCVLWAVMKLLARSSLPRYVSGQVLGKGGTYLLSRSVGLVRPSCGEANDFKIILIEEQSEWCILT
jgi:hypothetical protein